MNKIGIVVLNYLNYSDTIECVESLKIDNYTNKVIVIVDNFSMNESWEELTKKYSNSEDVHLIRTNKNEGFARGNNFGIEYARNQLNCNHVLLLNNDTIISDECFVEKLIMQYTKGIAAIGPKIIGSDGFNQNPIYTNVTKDSVARHISFLKSLKFKIIQSKVYQNISKCEFASKIKNFFIRTENSSSESKKYSSNYILHGSCILLTETFFEYYPFLFPNTFLYYEENILALLCEKADISMKYITSTSIYHKEDQSSTMSFKNKNSIKHKYEIDSAISCLKLFDLTYKDIVSSYFVMNKEKNND